MYWSYMEVIIFSSYIEIKWNISHFFLSSNYEVRTIHVLDQRPCVSTSRTLTIYYPTDGQSKLYGQLIMILLESIITQLSSKWPKPSLITPSLSDCVTKALKSNSQNWMYVPLWQTRLLTLEEHLAFGLNLLESLYLD